ncbi:MAG: hypothetical protein M0Z42_10480, partial [Actinomycetota bacterium]|nr:hypothetical protein [Actinomycetota bacterium]
GGSPPRSAKAPRERVAATTRVPAGARATLPPDMPPNTPGEHAEERGVDGEAAGAGGKAPHGRSRRAEERS